MVRHIFKMMLTATCLLLPAATIRGEIQSADEARKAASIFFKEGNVKRLSNMDNLTLVHTETAGATPSYYVFNAKDGNGFIIVSADDTVSPVIGYSTSSSWHTKSVSTETKQLLDRAELPKRTASYNVTARSSNARKVLSTATWSQESPFNNNIPNRRLVGCVGTALAEILKYHRYPTTRPASLHKEGEAKDYDWTNMRDDNYRSGYSVFEANAVATLVADAAIAIGTDFGMSSSSAFEVKVPAALVETFGYDAGVSYKKGSEMDRASWDALIINEIDEGRPVLYSGQDLSAGHAFVCDGYEMHGNTPYFHINWGWGGAADGFYASNALNPTVSTNHSFNNLTTIVYNIKPAASGNTWSPVHITSDGNQTGMTMNVTDLVPGKSFTIRAGALKNISNHDFSGNVSVALFASDGTLKRLFGEGNKIKIMSLQFVNYVDFSFTVPNDASIADGDIVRLVTKTSSDTEWLPVANDLITTGYVKALGYIPPYVDININNTGNDVTVECSEPRVIKGRDFTFKVMPASADKVVTVKANGFILTPDAEKNYRIPNVNSEQNVSIIVQNASDVVSKRNIWVQAGNLQNLISDTDAGTITDLTLFGTIDATDFSFMRDRMKLSRLDISCVNIVASGANPANAIPTKAFSDCNSLRQIILPKNITTFKNGCFRNSGLESVEIPASVATYEYNVFVNCSRLREVVVRRSSPSWVNWCVFHGTPKTRLVVPVGASSAYKNKEYWKDFAIIEEENPTPASHYDVITEDVSGLRFIPVSESNQVAPGTEYKFMVETNDSFGDATMEMYANSTRIYANTNGVYKAIVNANTLIHAKFRYPEETRVSSWKITPAAGGIGLVTDVVNVVAGKTFTIRANAIAIPSDDAALFYCAALTDKDDRIKELISPVIANYSYNFGNLPANFTCQVKDATVREGNRVRIVTSYDKKRWSVVNGENDSVLDLIEAIGNKVVYHNINMPQTIEGAAIQGAVSKIVRGMPLSLKVTPVSVDDRITIAVNGINKIVDAAVANLSIPSVAEDLDIAIQVVPKGADAYTVVNVREGELAAKIEQCPSRLKVTGVMTSDDFKAFGAHAATITDLDLADVTIKGNGDLANAIPTNAFAPSSAAGVSSAIKKITLPSGLINIENNAFNRCVNLSEITLPASVTYVGSGAFASCIRLSKIIAQCNQPPTTGNMSPFPTNSSKIKLEIPKGSENLYENASYWKNLDIQTSKIYFNIQIDPERTFNYNDYYNLTKIEYPTTTTTQVTLGLPNSTSTKNPYYRKGVAFKVFDNGTDRTYNDSYVKYGQYSVKFDPTVKDPKYFSCPQNHKIDIVFHYAITFSKPEDVAAELVGLAEDEKWENVKYSLFNPNSTLKPTLYREGRDYRFKLQTSAPNIALKVVAKSRILSTSDATEPKYETTERLLVADENGIYTIINLQGDTEIIVTSSIIVEDGMTLTSKEIAMVSESDASDITSIGVSGNVDESVFNTIRENFESLKTLNLSEMANESIPDNAFKGMGNLRSIVIPETVSSVGSSSFAGCESLESVTLPGVEKIAENAFEGCFSLTSITITGSNNASSEVSTRSRTSSSARISPSAGMTDASFAGINPNCLIFVPDGYETSIANTPNVIVNKAGYRMAVSDITLDGNYPFNTPASFSLADHKISMTVNIPGSISDDNDGWKGIVLPFAPSSFEFGKEFTQRGEKPLTLRSFTDETAEIMTEVDAIKANHPYLASVYAPIDTIPVTFHATGLSTESEIVYDVPFTPASEEINARGKNFSLYGCYDSGNATGDIYALDKNGIAFVMTDDNSNAVPFSTFLRANGSNTPDSFNVGTHPVWVFNPTASKESGSKLYRSSKIELTSTTDGAKIFYTLDGSDPAASGVEYTAPFGINDESVSVRAIARFKGSESDITHWDFSLRKTSLEYSYAEGWNWTSHNVETELPVSDIMSDNVVRVLTPTKEAIRDPQLGIIGNLKTLRPLEAYKVFTSSEGKCRTINGISFDPTTPVSIRKGWNWIGCPVEDGSLKLNDLLAGFEAAEGDMIVSREGLAQADAEGRWIGSLEELRTGEGYMLLSAADKEFAFNITPSAKTDTVTSRSIYAEPRWNVESRKYPSVMPVISKITDAGIAVDNIEEYEIGAFCGNECRGMGIPVEGYMMINVYGNPDDKINFRLYSKFDNAEEKLPQEIYFSENPVGSLKMPHIFNSATSSISDGISNKTYIIHVENGTLYAEGDKAYVNNIEIYDISGIMIASAESELRIEHTQPGVYIVVVHTDNGAETHKINVK
ncbi:MAG: C10 family peptidase [Bacteroides sp.]|nr:C10 family peptidase [Bacteroides sp.]MCM1390957.1 C10 family peptidase [Bacteroides sp.]